MLVLMAAHSFLTEDEVQLLELLGTGMTNREIAAQRAISVRTVRLQIRTVTEKLHIGNRAEAARFASCIDQMRFNRDIVSDITSVITG